MHWYAIFWIKASAEMHKRKSTYYNNRFIRECTQSYAHRVCNFIYFLFMHLTYKSLRMAVLVYPEFTAFHHKVAPQTSSPLQVLCHTIIGLVPP